MPTLVRVRGEEGEREMIASELTVPDILPLSVGAEDVVPILLSLAL